MTGIQKDKTMLQEVMTAPGQIEFREIEKPEPKAGEVLVRMRRIGVCGSDIHVWHGKHPFTKYPVTQGHEVSGEIAALGAGVTGFAVGEKVTIEPQVVCGKCHPCKHGKYNLCEELKVMGFQTTGAASEYFAVDAAKVTKIPEKMSFDAVAANAIATDPNILEIDNAVYSNLYAKGSMLDRLNFGVLGALEVDTDFNINILTGMSGARETNMGM